MMFLMTSVEFDESSLMRVGETARNDSLISLENVGSSVRLRIHLFL